MYSTSLSHFLPPILLQDFFALDMLFKGNNIIFGMRKSFTVTVHAMLYPR